MGQWYDRVLLIVLTRLVNIPEAQSVSPNVSVSHIGRRVCQFLTQNGPQLVEIIDIVRIVLEAQFLHRRNPYTEHLQLGQQISLNVFNFLGTLL